MNEPQFGEIGGRGAVNMHASTLNQSSVRRTAVPLVVSRVAVAQVGYEGMPA